MCFYLWGSASDPTKQHQVLQPEKKKREALQAREQSVFFLPYNSLFLLHCHTESAAVCGRSRDRGVAWVVWTWPDLFFMDLRNWYDLRFAVIREVKWEGEATVLECVFGGSVACSCVSISCTFLPFWHVIHVLDLSSRTGCNIWSINGPGSVFYFGFAAMQLNASHLNKQWWFITFKLVASQVLVWPT